MRLAGLILALLLALPFAAARAQNCPGTLSACPPLSTGQINLGGAIVNQAGVPFVPPAAFGTAGQVLTTTGPNGATAWQAGGAGGGSTVPGGTTGQVQFNNGGVFGGLTAAQLTAEMAVFTSASAGDVPPSGGGTANFLRADGTWALPPSSSGGTVSSVAVATANGFAGIVATSTSTPSVTIETTISGLLKGNGTGVAAAVAGTDYVAPNGSGAALTGLLYGQLPAVAANQLLGALTATQPAGLTVPSCSGANSALTWTLGTGFGCNTINVGTPPGGTTGQVQFNNGGVFGGLTAAQLTAEMAVFTSALAGDVPASGGGTANFLRADGTWSLPPSSSGGTVSSVSVATANGFSGTVATATSTPSISMGTTVTGIMKGNGTAVAAAVAGTDYVGPTGSGAGLTGLGYGQLPALAANQVLGALTATTPAGLTVPSCAGAANALTWTAGTGFGCNSIATPLILDPREMQFPSATNTTIAAGTYDSLLYTPWAAGSSTIASLAYQTGGTSPSFSVSVQIGGVNVTGCSGIVVTSATAAVATCTGANAIPVGSHVTVVIASPTGTITDPRIEVIYSHSVN